MNNLRFISHTGEINTITRLHPKSIFVLDANTALNFIQNSHPSKRLNEKHFHLLRETRRRVRYQWTERSNFIPVDPVLALMELTRQDKEPNYENFLQKFEAFFSSVYSIDNYDRAWVHQTYSAAYRLLPSVHTSIQKTLQKIQTLAPLSGTLNHGEILKRIDEFLEWITSEKTTLAVIGGPLLQLAVYAIAGSPEASRFLKLNKQPKDDREVVAKNVAWDLMHWINLDFHYYYAKYPSTVVCTSDQALADFLLSRKNLAPRIGRTALLNRNVVNAYGITTAPKLSRLDGTRLSAIIAERVNAFWEKVSEDIKDEVFFTPTTENL